MGKRPPAVGLLAAAAASAIAAFAVGAVAHRAGIAPRPSPLWRTWGLAPPADLVLLTVYLLLNPGLEEWFWRGTLLGEGVRRRLGRAGAWTLSVGAFLPFHLVFLVRSFGVLHGALFAVGVLGLASFWAALCERHGHAWWSAASHLGADLGVVLLYLRFLRQ